MASKPHLCVWIIGSRCKIKKNTLCCVFHYVKSAYRYDGSTYVKGIKKSKSKANFDNDGFIMNGSELKADINPPPLKKKEKNQNKQQQQNKEKNN